MRGTVPKLGVWWHAPQANFEILQPLRLFLVAYESTCTNKAIK
jgi:hypothetical protein